MISYEDFLAALKALPSFGLEEWLASEDACWHLLEPHGTQLVRVFTIDQIRAYLIPRITNVYGGYLDRGTHVWRRKHPML